MSKLIGSGNYGCVYRPPVACKTPCIKDVCKTGIVKIMSDENAADEIAIDKMIGTIDPHNMHHYPVEHTCAVAHSLVDDCEHVFEPDKNNKNDENDKFHPVEKITGIFYRDGGITLREYATKKTLNTNFYLSIANLMNDVIMLNGSGMQHRDIRPENVVVRVTPEYTDTRLIDFGLAVKVEGDYHDEIYTNDYPYWPLECLVMSKPIEKLRTGLMGAAMQVNRRIDERDKFHRKYGLPEVISVNEVMGMIKKVTKESVVEAVLKGIDSYSFGILLAEVARAINLRSDKKEVDKSMANSMLTIAKVLADPNSVNRRRLPAMIKHYLYYLTKYCRDFKDPYYHLVNSAVTLKDERVLEKLVETARGLARSFILRDKHKKRLIKLTTDWNTGPRQYLYPSPLHALEYNFRDKTYSVKKRHLLGELYQTFATMETYLRMYTYNYMSDDSRWMCNIALSKGYHVKTFLIPYGADMSIELISQHLRSRIPVYYGKVMYENFDRDYTSGLMGIENFEAELQIPGAYVICGPVVGEYKGAERYSHAAERYAYVAHTWHANFESHNTSDYKLYHSSGRFDLARYQKRCLDMFTAIDRAAMVASEQTKKKARILLPRIGLGAYVSAVDARDLIEANARAIEQVWPTGRTDVELHLCEFDPSQKFRPLNSIAERKTDLFDIGNDTNVILVLVNAWDNRSYIGNGGSQDPTIDGFMVSGFGAGAKFPNSSYIHNHFISHITIMK